MRNFLASLFSSLIVAAIAFPLTSCIAHAPNSGGGSGGTTVVTISPTTATVSGGGTQNLTATVTGSELAGVTWNVNDMPNGTAALGLITQNPTCTAASPTLCAIYTAPATVPNPPEVSITAASLDTSGTLSSPATFTITPSQVAVSVLPPTFTLQAGASTTYTATVTGSSNVGVVWSVNGVPNGNANVGMITAMSTATGSIATYTAPPPIDAPTQSPASITISAKPMANAFLEADATAMILPIIVTVSPASTVQIPVSSPASSNQTFTATVTGATDTTVTNWQVNQIPGGDSTIGTIVSTGGNTALYTAPPSVSTAPFPITITAVSNADSNSSGSVLGNVHVTVTVSPATDTIGQGANLQYSAMVNGTTNQSVQWSAAGGAGAFDSPADNAGLFVATEFSTGGQTTITGTITATSTFDQFQFGPASITVQGTDPLGKVMNVQTLPSSQCPADSNGGLANGTCYQMDVSCPDIADLTSYIKVNTPPAGVTPTGTVLFLIGGGGNGLYDSYWTYGYETVEMVNNGATASFNTVQISFGLPFTANQPNGWLQGPGGVRRLACRYATIADWVYNNPKYINPSSVATNSAPMCGTGNSGGSAALGYALYNYGLGASNTNGPVQEFSMVDLTSGPVTTRLDEGCVCNTVQTGPAVPSCLGNQAPTTMCYLPSEAAIIDPAYQVQNQLNQPTLCSEGLSGTNTSQAIRMASDSIEYAPTKNPAISLSPSLSMFMRFGGMDTTTGVPQGMTWWKGVNPPQQPLCTLGADHEIPNLSQGATDIANDIATYCP